MKSLQITSDKAAIGLSFICALHCLAFPVLTLLIPSAATLAFAGEKFHIWMVAAVIPTSIFALTMGCRKHKRYRFAALGSLGLLLLGLALVLEESPLGESGETILTLLGTSLLAFAHYRNYRLCQAHENCACH